MSRRLEEGVYIFIMGSGAVMGMMTMKCGQLAAAAAAEAAAAAASMVADARVHFARYETVGNGESCVGNWLAQPVFFGPQETDHHQEPTPTAATTTRGQESCAVAQQRSEECLPAGDWALRCKNARAEVFDDCRLQSVPLAEASPVPSTRKPFLPETGPASVCQDRPLGCPCFDGTAAGQRIRWSSGRERRKSSRAEDWGCQFRYTALHWSLLANRGSQFTPGDQGRQP